VVQGVHPPVEPARVGRVGPAKQVDVEVVGELVQERVEHSAVACHLAQDGGAHPGPEDAGLDRVVAMELGLEVAVANPVPSHAQDLELGRRHAVEVCEKVEQLLSRAAHPRGLRSLEGRAQPFATTGSLSASLSGRVCVASSSFSCRSRQNQRC